MKQFFRISVCAALLVLFGACAGTTTPASPTPLSTAVPVSTAVPPTPQPSPTPAPTATPRPPLTEYPLSGLPAESPYAGWPPLAVMIPSDSGQYGLAQASLVFEAVTEAHIPRFLAFFEQVQADRIGPVRSARPYFVDWACPYSPLFVYWGGSPQALAILGTSDCLRPLDGQTYGKAYFTHVEDAQVPWNSEFSSSALLYGYLQNWEITRTVDFGGFLHKDDAPAGERPPTATLSFTFSYPVRYTYDPRENVYEREVEGRPHLDLLTGEQIRVKNVVVIFVPQSPIPGDDLGRMEFQVAGEGDALVLRDGVLVRGRWEKASSAAELRLLDEAGQGIALNRGNVWVEVLAPAQEVIIQGGK